MNNNFDRFKKKLIIECIIKSVIYGIGCGILSISILAIILKLNGLDMPIYIYAIITIAVSLLCSLGFYFLLKPDDITIAKRMDKSLNLNQKVQTMITYKNNGQDNVIIKKQRDDTEEKLSQIETKKMPMKFFVGQFVFVAIALGCLSCSILTPLKEAPHGDNSSSISSNGGDISSDSNLDSIISSDSNSMVSSIDIDQWTDEKIDELIDKVQNSNLSDELKQEIINELEELRDKLHGIENQEEREQLINEAIDKINQLIEDSTSKEDIGESLKDSEDEIIASLGQAIIDGDVNAIAAALQRLEAELNSLTGQELINRLNEVAQEIKDALIASGVDAEDALYKALDLLADKFIYIANKLTDGTYTDEEAKAEISKAIEEVLALITQAIEDQQESEKEGEQISDELGDLVNPDQDSEGNDEGDGDQKEDGDPTDGDGDPTDGDNNDNKDPSDNPNGAEGEGNTNYGSNDKVVTENGESEYGDVLDEYYDDVVGGDDNEDTPDDVDDIIDDYFGSLYGNDGSGDDSGDGQSGDGQGNGEGK